MLAKTDIYVNLSPIMIPQFTNCIIYTPSLLKTIEDLENTPVRDEPVNGWEVLPLGKLLVQAPEHLYDTQGSRSDRVGEVTTGR